LLYTKKLKRANKCHKNRKKLCYPKKYLTDITGKTLGEKIKNIDDAVKKTFQEYGELLKLLGRE